MPISDLFTDESQSTPPVGGQTADVPVSTQGAGDGLASLFSNETPSQPQVSSPTPTQAVPQASVTPDNNTIDYSQIHEPTSTETGIQNSPIGLAAQEILMQKATRLFGKMANLCE